VYVREIEEASHIASTSVEYRVLNQAWNSFLRFESIREAILSNRLSGQVRQIRTFIREISQEKQILKLKYSGE
jgi:hypothetical protein